MCRVEILFFEPTDIDSPVFTQEFSVNATQNHFSSDVNGTDFGVDVFVFLEYGNIAYACCKRARVPQASALAAGAPMASNDFLRK
jgi:hypothetical protein